MSKSILRGCLRSNYFTYCRILQRCISKVKYVAELQGDIEEQMKSHEMKPRKHPGRRKTGHVIYPEQLVKAVKKVADDFHPKMFEEAKRLNNQFLSRRPAIERKEYTMRADLLLAKKFRRNPEEITDEKYIAFANEVRNKLRQETERWKPIEYDDHTSKVHLIARLAGNFSVISWVFSEIKHCIPSFAPATFLDFGSGVGSAVWAAYNTWGSEIKEYFCVDSSSDMNNLAACLLKDDSEENEKTFVNELYFRQFLPTSDKIKYDIVVSAFSMMELPSLKERLRVIDILWQKTTDTLVVIESGSFAGYSMVMDARDYILHIENGKKGHGTPHTSGAYVVAPCPHDMPCPKLQGQKLIPCNFEVHYRPLFTSQGNNMWKERFSFVVLRKRKRQIDIEYWPRIMKTSPLRKHVHCHLCCSDGQLHEVVFTKAKNTREAYRCARVSSEGDLLPVSLSTVIKGSEEYEEESQSES